MNIIGIDLGSTQTCVIIAQKDENNLRIVGSGKTKTSGIKKGVISDISLAAKSIQSAVQSAQMTSGVQHFDRVVVSISGAYASSADSMGFVNIDNEINISTIHRAIITAKHGASIANDANIIHMLPYNFTVDNISNIEDPLGMSGKRLVVKTHIVTSQESYIKNLTKAVELAGLRVDNLVLSGYASAIACLDESERELGAVVIDMGGAICDVVIHLGNSIRYNEFLPVGSSHITRDLASALSSPIHEAERIKLDYANLSQDPNALIKVLCIGDEKKTNDFRIEIISKVIYARAHETLMLLAGMISENEIVREKGAGIVLTGGMTKLAGMEELASVVFDSKNSVRLATARKDLIDGFDELFNDPENTCAIGLCLYGAGYFTPYEFDSNQRLRYRGEESASVAVKEKPSTEKNEDLETQDDEEELLIGVNTEVADSKPGVFKTLWNKLVSQF